MSCACYGRPSLPRFGLQVRKGPRTPGPFNETNAHTPWRMRRIRTSAPTAPKCQTRPCPALGLAGGGGGVRGSPRCRASSSLHCCCEAAARCRRPPPVLVLAPPLLLTAPLRLDHRELSSLTRSWRLCCAAWSFREGSVATWAHSKN